jgi:hypothetical protein
MTYEAILCQVDDSMIRKLDTQKTRKPEDSLTFSILIDGFILLESHIRNKTT